MNEARSIGVLTEPAVTAAPASAPARRDRWTVLAIVVVLMLVYNANGREIGSVDSQPTKYAALELVLHHTLSLNHTVGAVPEYANRPQFVLARDDTYRSAYSPLPSIVAAAVAWPFWRAGLIDLRAPRAGNAVAVATASLLTCFTVAIAFLEARRRTTRGRALAVAAGLGLGTGLWNAVSRTLWVHETSILGVMIAVFGFASDTPLDSAVGVGLALAGAARPQLAPVILILLAGLWYRRGWRHALAAGSIVGAAAGAMMLVNVHWFGSPFGPLITIARSNDVLHATSSAFVLNWRGLVGLLVSPNRGLLVFSPVAIVGLALPGWGKRDRWLQPFAWCAVAAAAQWIVYGSYSIWWGGHTFGPRYMLDILALLVPAAAVTVSRLRIRSVAGAAVCAALVWSIAVAATGSFYYPNGAWNSSPTDIDRDHARLWSWSDMQIVRCWKQGPSPHNFDLFSSTTFRLSPARERRQP